ncbi:MAG: zinc ribbon domain-containing protein [Negativicutes bacterium]|nr:zinc ribbon domain-containing protein [Negativicutes bacterium]
MTQLFCQSCGMPLETEEVMGTNKEGSKNTDYCIYCYKEGNFTEDVTMDEMIEISLKHMKEFFKDDPSFKEEEALANMKEFFPKLKRWS